MLTVARTLGLFLVTAVAEIGGCYLVFLWLRRDRSPLLVIGAVACLCAFAGLLTLHPAAAGRTYAAYGGVYVATAIAWLALVEGQRPTRWDLIGAAVTLVGMAVIAFAPRG